MPGLSICLQPALVAHVGRLLKILSRHHTSHYPVHRKVSDLQLPHRSTVGAGGSCTFKASGAGCCCCGVSQGFWPGQNLGRDIQIRSNSSVIPGHQASFQNKFINTTSGPVGVQGQQTVYVRSLRFRSPDLLRKHNRPVLVPDVYGILPGSAGGKADADPASPQLEQSTRTNEQDRPGLQAAVGAIFATLQSICFPDRSLIIVSSPIVPDIVSRGRKL